MIEEEIQVQFEDSMDFEFDGYTLSRVSNHWEIVFEDEQGLQAILIEKDSFNEYGELIFDIDGEEKIFTLDDLKTVETFCTDAKLI